MIQLTKLSRTLTNGYIAWVKKNNHDYIISEHFILKTKQKIKGSALTKLISLIGTVPQEEQGFQNRNRYSHRKEMTECEIKNMIDLLECKDKKSIYFTNLIHQADNKMFSIFKGEEDYIFINKIYTDLIDLNVDNIKIYGKNKVSPIYFIKDNEEVMLLPVRLKEVPFYLK